MMMIHFPMEGSMKRQRPKSKRLPVYPTTSNSTSSSSTSIKGIGIWFVLLLQCCAVATETGVCVDKGDCEGGTTTMGAFVTLSRDSLQQENHNDCRNALGDEICEAYLTGTTEDGFDDEKEHACLMNPEFMREYCAKACMVCFDGSETTISIGMPQRIDETEAEDAETVARFWEVLSETAFYMKERVMLEDAYQPVRRSCRNENEFCAWEVAATDGDFCEDEDAAAMCGPACQSCGQFVLTENELKVYKDCRNDPSKNAFVNDNDDDDDDDERRNHNQSTTIDAMFRRIVGELPYPAGTEHAYPVPGVNYTVKVISRPSVHPEKHGNKSLDSLDFHIGGPWIVVLDDFLTPEECDGILKAGDKLEWEQSTIGDDPDEDDNDDDDEHMTEIDTEEWRTSKTAWCMEECLDDPIIQSVQDKIALTTGVLDVAYFEYLQLLRYSPGEYYKEHHDEERDVDLQRFLPEGPRILTFFLYLEDVPSGGETRFTDILGDHSGVYIDVKPKKGRALLWPSMINENILTLDDRTYHEARSVREGKKYAANFWLRLRNFRTETCNKDDLEAIKEKLLFD